MNGILQVKVNDTNAWAKASSSSKGGFGALSKYSVYLYLNGNELPNGNGRGPFQASSTPYQFQLAPGNYVLRVTRNKDGGKSLDKKLLGFTIGGMMGLMTQDASVFEDVSSSINGMSDDEAQKKGYLAFSIADGQTVSIEIQVSKIKGDPMPVLIR